jgi:SAM-dependent methyltransferase
MPTTNDRDYRDDLAYIHDAGYGGFARAASACLLEWLRETGIQDGLVVDLGCGSGIWAEVAVDAGWDVLGYDLAPAMVALAERRAPAGRFVAESFVTATIPRCACVTAMGEIFNYRSDPRNSDATLERVFRRVHAALVPGGLFVFDGAEPGRGGKTGQTRGFSLGDDWACLAAASEDPARRTLTRDITSFRKVGSTYRRDRETHVLRLFDRQKILAALRKLGFHARTIRGYGEMRFPPGYIGFVAKKRR